MTGRRVDSLLTIVMAMAGSVAVAGPALAQSAGRDAIGDLLQQTGSIDKLPQSKQTPSFELRAPPAVPADPRAGDAAFEQAKALMTAIDAILKSTADSRAGASKLPSRSDYMLPPIWTETREDRADKVRALIDSALAIVTDVPVVETQRKVEELRKSIRSIEDETAALKEKQLVAPKYATLPGLLNDTVQSLDAAIAANQKRIEAKQAEIAAAKAGIAGALRTSGIEISEPQVDLLLDSVLSGDLVRLVAVFDAAKIIDGQLAKLIGATGDNMTVARKYFAMHAALFAMLVQAQDATLEKIETQYMPKLDAITADIEAARKKTTTLLKAENRPDQKRALDANRDSQKLADEAAKAYRRYLMQQSDQIATARKKAAHDLSIADNTFETVEASVQLRNLMRESAASFEAIQKLEAPSFEQIFKNDELRREFDNLTRKLDTPSS
ncbi:MAG: hypothetical protein K2X41_06830 [Hyphomicrobium sp.]|nr:hypothetical protein [Hyphomicrobium sp.]